MKFKIDENLPREVAELFVNGGHDVETVHAEGLVGATDDDLARVCQSEGRAIVTLDVGFGDFRRYPLQQFSGIIVLRPRSAGRLATVRLAVATASSLNIEPLAGCLWIVSEKGIRIRKGAP